MSNPVALQTHTSQPDLELVEQLEQALELARAGDLRSLVLVGELRGNEVLSIYSFEDNLRMLGHLMHAIEITNRAVRP